MTRWKKWHRSRRVNPGTGFEIPIKLYASDAPGRLISVLVGDDFKIPSGHGAALGETESFIKCIKIWEESHGNGVCQSLMQTAARMEAETLSMNDLCFHNVTLRTMKYSVALTDMSYWDFPPKTYNILETNISFYGLYKANTKLAKVCL